MHQKAAAGHEGELAWWLLDTALAMKPEIYFRGCWPHKGLAEETGYPFIWHNIRPPRFQEQEDHLLGRSANNDGVILRRLCENFIEEFGVPRHLPFLHTGEPGFQPYPEFPARHEEAKELLRRVLLVVAGKADTPSVEESEERDQAELLQSKLRGWISRRGL